MSISVQLVQLVGPICGTYWVRILIEMGDLFVIEMGGTYLS